MRIRKPGLNDPGSKLSFGSWRTYLDRDGDVDEGGDQLDRNGGQDVGQEYRASGQGIAVAPGSVPCTQWEMGAQSNGWEKVKAVL